MVSGFGPVCLYLNSILFDYNFHEFYYFRLMFNVSRAAANHLGLKDLLPETSLPDQLLHQLEILACDSLTLQHRPAEVALALLATNFQQRATREPGHSTALMGFISELQKYCNVSRIMMISRPILPLFDEIWYCLRCLAILVTFWLFWQQTSCKELPESLDTPQLLCRSFQNCKNPVLRSLMYSLIKVLT